MTAIVGVLNRKAVAIAADSAVTMGNTHKVINSANKIFTLSKYHPVAVMTYNNADFMGVPWDIVIKEYRKHLKDKSYPYLKDYVEDFIKYLHKRNFFCDGKTQQKYTIHLLDLFLKICRDEILKEKNISIDRLTKDLLEEKLKNCLESNQKSDKCPEFVSYSFDDFKSYASSSIKDYANINRIGVDNTELLMEAFFYYMTSKLPQPFYTGLVFVGYGEAEIYPSLYPINVSLGIDKRLRYYYDKCTQIKEHGIQAAITPFAQIDVTQTIIRGINPSFLDIIHKVIYNYITDFSDAITKILDSNPSTTFMSTEVRKLDLKAIVKNMADQINGEMYKAYTNPLLNTVKSLDKEDMANMAESFISLTSLVRRMQPGEETVGGPVDVAVITKGDGFVWIKRKHYFDPKLNSAFFSNYFN